MSDTTDEGLTDRSDAMARDVSRDELFEILASERRRTVVSVLADREPPVGVDALARAVAERGGDPESVRVSLYHIHLPKLDAVGLITFDPGRRTVTRVADGLEDLLAPERE